MERECLIHSQGFLVSACYTHKEPFQIIGSGQNSQSQKYATMVWVSGSEPEGRNIVIQALLGADTTDRTAAGLGEGLNDDRDPRFSPCQFVQGFWVSSALALINFMCSRA